MNEGYTKIIFIMTNISAAQEHVANIKTALHTVTSYECKCSIDENNELLLLVVTSVLEARNPRVD
jgi:hypothetical protein